MQLLKTNLNNERTQNCKEKLQKQQIKENQQKKNIKMTLKQYLESVNLKRNIASRSRSKENHKKNTQNINNCLQIPSVSIGTSQYFKLNQQWKSKKIFNNWVTRLKQLCRQYIKRDEQFIEVNRIIEKLSEFVKNQIQSIKKDNLLLQSYLVTQASYWPEGQSNYNHDHLTRQAGKNHLLQDKNDKLSNYLKTLLKNNQFCLSPGKSQIINNFKQNKFQVFNEKGQKIHENFVHIQNKISSEPKVKIYSQEYRNEQQENLQTISKQKQKRQNIIQINQHISSTSVKQNQKECRMQRSSQFYRDSKGRAVQNSNRQNNSLKRVQMKQNQNSFKMNIKGQNQNKKRFSVYETQKNQHNHKSIPQTKDTEKSYNLKNNSNNNYSKQQAQIFTINQRQKYLVYSFKDPINNTIKFQSAQNHDSYDFQENKPFINSFHSDQNQQNNYVQNCQEHTMENYQGKNFAHLKVPHKVATFKQSLNILKQQQSQLQYQKSIQQVPRLSLMSRFDQNKNKVCNNSMMVQQSQIIPNSQNTQNQTSRISQMSTKQEISLNRNRNNSSLQNKHNSYLQKDMIINLQNQKIDLRKKISPAQQSFLIRNRDQFSYSLQSNYRNQNLIKKIDEKDKSQGYVNHRIGNNNVSHQNNIQSSAVKNYHQKMNQSYDSSTKKIPQSRFRNNSVHIQKMHQSSLMKQNNLNNLSHYSPSNVVLLQTPQTLKINKNPDPFNDNETNQQKRSSIIVRTNMIQSRENITKRYENYRRAVAKR